MAQRIFTIEGSTRDWAHTWNTFLRADGLDVREVAPRELGSPSLADPANLFRAAHDYAVAQGFVGAWPTFRTTGGEYAARHELVLLGPDVAEPAEYPAEALGDADRYDCDNLLRAVHHHSWTVLGRRLPAFPTFHRREEGGRVLFGVVQLKPRVGVHTRVYERELGCPTPQDLVGHVRALHELAVRRGFATALFTGNIAWPESEVCGHFQHHLGMRHLVENEGWKVARVEPLGAQRDGEGLVRFAALVVLEKE